MSELSTILNTCHELQASDVHLSQGQVTHYRVHGRLQPKGQMLDGEAMQAILAEMDPDLALSQHAQGSYDFGYSDSDGFRYRVNAYRELGRLAIALRYLNNQFSSLQQLHLPEQIVDLTQASSGLVLVCGATGSGKTTTLAALLDRINQTRHAHILTIEDPVEFIHQSQKSMIHQRELGRDFDSFANAVRAALREDPDVLMVGELRDLETIRTAMTAAETGHLVFSTLHTNDAISSVERLIGAFPGNEQDMCRVRLSRCLRGVIAQRLIQIDDEKGKGRIPAVEILLGLPAVVNLIENNKTRQLYSVMESHRPQGMQTLDQALAQLVQQRWITEEQAQQHARKPAQIVSLIKQTPSVEQR